MQLYNKRDSYPPEAVYIGRQNRKVLGWGNPYSHLDLPHTIKVDSREEAVLEYARYLWRNWDTLHPEQLAGKDLVCWCSPKLCHGEALMAAANGGKQGLLEYVLQLKEKMTCLPTS